MASGPTVSQILALAAAAAFSARDRVKYRQLAKSGGRSAGEDMEGESGPRSRPCRTWLPSKVSGEKDLIYFHVGSFVPGVTSMSSSPRGPDEPRHGLARPVYIRQGKISTSRDSIISISFVI